MNAATGEHYLACNGLAWFHSVFSIWADLFEMLKGMCSCPQDCPWMRTRDHASSVVRMGTLQTSAQTDQPHTSIIARGAMESASEDL